MVQAKTTFVCLRPSVQNILLVVLIVPVLFCVKDAIYRQFKESNVSNDAEFSSHALYDGSNSTERELVLVQMLFRHGHRSPFMLYPYDPNSVDDWEEGLGMLTKLGRLQHYMLGLHLRERYKEYITTNPKEIEMINSNNFRCQFGVYCFIAGMYAPTDQYSFTDDVPWQPIVSRSANWQGKNILTRGRCPLADNEEKNFKRGEQANATREKYQDLYNFWSKNSGRLIDSWVLASDLGKTLACEREYNQTIPEWALKHWDEFAMQTGIAYYFNYGTKLIQKYKIGPLMAFMTDQIKDKIMGKLPEKKVFIYSAHGSNIACLMLGLDQYDWKGPPYASTVILELWKQSGSDLADYSVRWLYYNSSNPERQIDPPVVFRLGGWCEGREFCPLQRFMDTIQWMLPEDWEAECENPAMAEMFKPFESTVFVPALTSSSSFVSFSSSVLSFLLICIFYSMNSNIQTFG